VTGQFDGMAWEEDLSVLVVVAPGSRYCELDEP